MGALRYSRVHNLPFEPFLQLSWYITTQHTHNGYIVQIRNANMLPRCPKVGPPCMLGLEVAYL